MALVPYIQNDEASPEAKAVFAQIEAMGATVPNALRVVAHSPQLLRDWWAMMATLLFSSDLDTKLRELVLLRIFKTCGCDYCFTEHIGVALREGVTQDQIDRIEDFATYEGYSELERAAMQYANSIASENKVDEAAHQILRKSLNDKQFVELAFCIGNWIGLSHFLAPMGLEVEGEEG